MKYKKKENMGDLNIKRDFIKEAGLQSGLLKKKMVKT